MESRYRYIVGVQCDTFNHSKFILDTLNGFVIQQTTFPFVVMVIDDASTDGNQDVIRQFFSSNFDVANKDIVLDYETDYAYFTYAQHNTNKNCYMVVMYLKENHYSQRKPRMHYLNEWRDTKYVAMCEGDDYWTDPYKLQKQVDFLEANPEYSMCFANAIEHWENGSKEDRCFSNVEDRDYTGVEIYKKWTIPTASVLFRKEIILSQRYNEVKSNKNFIFGDIVLFLTCAEFGKLRGMSDIVSVYRRHDNGATGKNSFSLERSIKFAYHQRELGLVFGKDKTILDISKRNTCSAFVHIFFQYIQKKKNGSVFFRESLRVSCSYTIKYLCKYLLRYFSKILI